MTTATITVPTSARLSQKQVLAAWHARNARELVGKTVRVSRVIRTGPAVTYKLVIDHAGVTPTRRLGQTAGAQ